MINYYIRQVRVWCVTKLRSPGDNAIGNCTMPVTVPEKEALNMRSWRKIENQGRQLFKLYLPRISERNGPICCYRIFMVKLGPQKTTGDLPSPEDMEIHTYHYAHASPAGGAYLAEMFDSDHPMPEVFLGDGEWYNSSTACDRCIGLRTKATPTLHLLPEMPSTANTNASVTSTMMQPTFAINLGTAPITVAPVFSETTMPSQSRNDSSAAARRKRDDQAGPNLVPIENPPESGQYPPYDGFLDEEANYTAFIEVIGTLKKAV